MANSSLNSLADYSSSDDEEVLQLPKTRCARQTFSRSPQPNRSDDDCLASSEGEDEQSQPKPSTSSDHDLAPAQSHEIPDEESEEDSVSTPAKKRRISAYALPMDQLPGPLQKFLEAVKKFFTQKVNLQRQRAPVSMTTYDKAQERMLCYLGYVRSTLAADAPFTEDCFLNIPTIEAYVDFLKEERNASSATCSNHLSSLLYALKFMHREYGPEFKDIQIIRQIRAQATILHKQGDIERPSTKEDLDALNRWISWDEVVGAVTAQRQRFESTHQLKLKAWHCSDLVLLSLYVYLPPSRGLEVRTLEIVRDRSKLDARKSRDRNFLIVNEDGSGLRLQINRYKTQKFRGRDEVAIQPGDELCRVIKTYIDNYRPQLITEVSGDFLLVNRSGNRFSSGAFSGHLRRLIFGLTGKIAAVNALRSAFVTWAYGKSDCTDALRNSLANALRHSRRQAEQTYDKRTANEKKELAVQMTKAYAERSKHEPVELETREETAAANRDTVEHNFKPGDFVALVEGNSTCDAPQILLGQVASFVSETEVLLLWYKPVQKNLYKLELNGEQWEENVDCLVAVEVEPVKDPLGCYRLLTSQLEIHKQVME